MRIPLLCAVLALSAPALAVPLQLTQQGRLLDSAGAPLTGAHDLSFSLYDGPAGGSAVWTETQSLELDAGFYSALLGDVTPLEAAHFGGGTLYLGIAVDGGAELSSRVAVVSVPYAVLSGHAESATSVSGGGVVDATEIRIDGTKVIDGSTVFGDGDTLGELSCASDQVARFDGSGWACADAGDHGHDAGDIATGVLDVDRLPVGTGTDQVAPGDHDHTSFGASIEVAGSVKVAGDTGTCDTTKEGAVRYAGGLLQVCAEGGWRTISLVADGSTKDASGQSCLAIKRAYPAAADGVYWLDPNGGATTNAFQAWCDMTTDGGGWTLVSQARPVTNTSLSLCGTGEIGTIDLSATEVKNPAKLTNNVINQVWSPARELLVFHAADSSSTNPSSWDRICIADFKSTYNWHTGTTNAVSDLDTATIKCLKGSMGDGTFDQTWSSGGGGNVCGYGFHETSSNSYLIYTASTSYSGGACTGNAGRSWLGPGNWGCNVTKTFVR